MKKIILLLSLIFSLFGIFLAFFFVFFYPTNISQFLHFIISCFSPYHYSGFDIYIVTERTSEHSFSSASLTLLNLFFYLTFLAGSIIYYFSKYKETKLLLFNYSLVFLSSIINVTTFLRFSTIKISILEISYIIITTIIHIFISFYFITKYLNTNILDNDDLQNSSNSKRFLNLLIDSIIIISVVFGLITYAQVNSHINSFLNYLRLAFGEKFGSIAFFYSIKFIYYLLFESIFKSTPGKFLTACYVTDEEGNPPTFSMILKRTLFRFIPFESLSFLIGKNLHDDYSDTYVINKKTDSKTEKKYLQTLSICFLIMLVIYFFNLSTRHHF